MKKCLALVTVLCLLASVSVSFAVPSKTTTDLSTVSSFVVDANTSVSVDSGFTVEVTEDDVIVQQELEKIYTHVMQEAQAPITYFATEIQEEIIAKLPETVKGEELELLEFVTIQTQNYDEIYGGAKGTFSFTTKYSSKQHVVVILTLYTGEIDAFGNPVSISFALEATPIDETGELEIYYTSEQLLLMQNSQSASLAVLSEPVTE